jgi:uncharacterized protein (TIGR04255 family)
MSEQWSNPPVFYALAQVQFNAIAGPKFADDIQEAFREIGFPDAIREETRIVLLAPGTSPEDPPTVTPQSSTRVCYMNTKRTEGFVWLPNALCYHTADYQTFEAFKERFVLGLKTLMQVTKPDYVTRVGARYLDLVRPEAGETLDRYLIRDVLGLSSKLRAGGHTLSETVMIELPLTVVSRVFVSNFEQPQPNPPIPAEMLPLHLKLQDKFQNAVGTVALLDTDSFEAIDRQPFDIEQIGDSLARVRKGVRQAFDAIITKHAVEKWN